MEENQRYDIPLETLRVVRIPKQIFTASFIFGSALLLIFLGTRNQSWIGVGVCYVGIAFVANIIALICMVAYALNNRDHMQFILWNTAILLLNIPIAYAYTLIVIAAL